MGRASVWSNSDGLAVGFGTRSETRGCAFRVADNGATQKLYVDVDLVADLGTSIAATDDFIVYGPVIPNGAVILSGSTKVTEAAAGGTDIDIGLYDKDGTVVDADGIDAAIATASLTLGAEVAADGADINTAVATTGGVKLGVIRTGTFTAGKVVIEVEYAVPNVG